MRDDFFHRHAEKPRHSLRLAESQAAPTMNNFGQPRRRHIHGLGEFRLCDLLLAEERLQPFAIHVAILTNFRITVQAKTYA